VYTWGVPLPQHIVAIFVLYATVRSYGEVLCPLRVTLLFKRARSKWVVGAGLAPALDTRKGCPYNRN
jgi:hypothetical protein